MRGIVDVLLVTIIFVFSEISRFTEFDGLQWYLLVLGKSWEELVNSHKFHIHNITYAAYELIE